MRKSKSVLEETRERALGHRQSLSPSLSPSPCPFWLNPMAPDRESRWGHRRFKEPSFGNQHNVRKDRCVRMHSSSVVFSGKNQKGASRCSGCNSQRPWQGGLSPSWKISSKPCVRNRERIAEPTGDYTRTPVSQPAKEILKVIPQEPVWEPIVGTGAFPVPQIKAKIAEVMQPVHQERPEWQTRQRMRL